MDTHDERWKEFEARCVPTEAPDYVRESLRVAYSHGAMDVLGALLDDYQTQQEAGGVQNPTQHVLVKIGEAMAGAVHALGGHAEIHIEQVKAH